MICKETNRRLAMDGQENKIDAMVVEEAQPEQSRNTAKPKRKWGRIILKTLYFLRSVPVVVVIAIIAAGLATTNMTALPEVMRIGEYEITRHFAVMAPATGTAVCLGMALLSKRPIYPMLISLLTLAVPVFLKTIAPYLA